MRAGGSLSPARLAFEDLAQHLLRGAARVRTIPPGDARLAPSFLVIGGQRCGTTSLYSYLIEHPLVVQSLVKEAHFFDNHFDRGGAWYSGYFPSQFYGRFVERRFGRKPITGEASPYYLFHPLAAERVARLLPDVKLIVLLRDPVARAWSHYSHEVAKGFEALSFEEAIECEERRLDGELERMVSDPSYRSFNAQHYSYLARGRYIDQIERWREHFPAEQLLTMNSSGLFSDPEAALNRVLRFLGLPPTRLRAYPKHNTYRHRPLGEETRRRLREYFAEPNRRLYEYVGTDYGWGS